MPPAHFIFAARRVRPLGSSLPPFASSISNCSRTPPSLATHHHELPRPQRPLAISTAQHNPIQVRCPAWCVAMVPQSGARKKEPLRAALFWAGQPRRSRPEVERSRRSAGGRIEGRAAPVRAAPIPPIPSIGSKRAGALAFFRGGGPCIGRLLARRRCGRFYFGRRVFPAAWESLPSRRAGIEGPHTHAYTSYTRREQLQTSRFRSIESRVVD
jgi:hypothetical protein